MACCSLLDPAACRLMASSCGSRSTVQRIRCGPYKGGFHLPEKGLRSGCCGVGLFCPQGCVKEQWAEALCPEAQEDESHVLKRGNEGQPPGPADTPEGPCLMGPVQDQLWVREAHGPALVLAFLRPCPGRSSACGLRKLRSPLPFALMPTVGTSPAEVPSLRWPGPVLHTCSSPPGLHCWQRKQEGPLHAPLLGFPHDCPSPGQAGPLLAPPGGVQTSQLGRATPGPDATRLLGTAGSAQCLLRPELTVGPSVPSAPWSLAPYPSASSGGEGCRLPVSPGRLGCDAGVSGQLTASCQIQARA